ncbi:hypothetical protein FZC74_12390 [Sutcliffiella horikoshii]|uniref:Uncharacterized protein n=1 Tax=Sutcliffiella horikoshii TaxID=79883 RepID=A0AA94WRR5_9BACI|nr:hypothetical protein [Sutcliffiella horikoshii]TYS58597.1 hypothetical protein FZC74_12390 [Sutcliffiella horikoshii]
MIENKDVIYFNADGEIVDQLEENLPLGTSISFCASAIVPDGFTFEFSGFDSSICSDLSELFCVVRPEEVQGTAPNPCGGTITCQLFVNAVRLVGTARFQVNIGNLIPNTPGTPLGPGPCRLGMETTVFVNEVFSYSSLGETCREKCFRNEGAFASLPTITTDECGRQIVTFFGGIFLGFDGCNCL